MPVRGPDGGPNQGLVGPISRCEPGSKPNRRDFQTLSVDDLAVLGLSRDHGRMRRIRVSQHDDLDIDLRIEVDSVLRAAEVSGLAA